MALPPGLPTVTIEFGPYSDLSGTVGYTGAQGFAVAVHPETFEPIEVYLADTGQLITDRPVAFTLDATGSGEVGPLVKPNTGETLPDNFAISVTFPAYGPSPEDRVVAIPPGAPDTVDYDDLVDAESEPVVSVPMAASLAQVAAAITEAQADADAAAGASISAAASAAAAAASAASADTRATSAETASAAAVTTADDAETIARNAFVGASIVGDNLVLTDSDDDETIAGNVRGPKGDPGDMTLAVYNPALPAGTQTLNAGQLATTRTWVLTGALTIAALPNISGTHSSVSATITLVLKQPSSGGPYTVTWPASLEWAGDAPAPAMPTAANSELIVHLFWTGSVWRAMNGGTFFPVRQAVVDLASQPVRNWAYNPRGVASPTGYGTQTLTPNVPIIGGPEGATTALRVAYGAGTINNPGAIFAGSAVRAGQMFYCQADVMVEAGETTSMGWALNGQIGQTTGLSTFTPGVWTRATWALTPAASADGRAIGFRLSSRADAVAGSLLITNVLIAERGSPAGGYGDGSYPGWRWTGAAGASESVGYPYTLESIAGRPAAEITGVGSVSLTLAQMPAMSGRTTYVVTDRLVLPGAGIAARFARGVQAAGGADMRSDNGGLYTFRPQYDGGGGGAGGVYSDAYTGSAPAAGTRNIHSVAEAEGLTSFEHEVNGGSPEGRTGMNPGTGHQTPGLVTELATVSGTTYESPVYAVQYQGAHSIETRKRVTAWLARRYGTPIPAGY